MAFKNSKKSQFMILSLAFLMLLLLYIYSQETTNPYIIDSGKNEVLEALIYETCRVGQLSNGSQLDFRFSSWENETNSYCINIGINCTFDIQKQGGAPSNLSLLNYSHYDYSVSYLNKGYSLQKNFSC